MKIELQISLTDDDLFKIKFDMDTGIITTIDNEGLINQEKVEKVRLPAYIKQTVEKILSIGEGYIK